MLKTKLYFLLIALLILLPGCFLLYTTPEVLIKADFNGDGIAVLNFTRQSSSTVSDLGKIAADKLTDALFLERKFNVIDRAVVNDVLISMDIKTTELLSVEQIQSLGEKLGANYLIVGRIQYFTPKEFLEADAEKELYVSFRILSVISGEVIGIGTHKSTFNEDLMDELSAAMYSLVRRM